jgi:hypothetical protein
MTTAKNTILSSTLSLQREVNAARPAAREARAASPLANDFIEAAQDYQASLLAVATRSPAYRNARNDFANAMKSSVDPALCVVAEDALLRHEMELCETSPVLARKHAAMLESGKVYMKSTPELALKLDLPPALRVWNHFKLILSR